MIERTTIFAALVLLLLAGCEGEAPPSVERSEYAAARAAAICDAPTCARGGVMLDARACLATMQPVLEAELQARLDQGGTYDAAAAGRCIADIKTAISDGIDAAAILAGDCNDVVTRQTWIGNACTVDATCLEGSFCDRSDDAHPYGICTKQGEHHRGALGAPCMGDEWYGVDGLAAHWSGTGTDGPSTLCHRSDGLACDSVSRACVRLSELGQSCSTTGACVEGYSCVGALDGSAVCQLPTGLGFVCDGACSPDQACIDGACTARRPIGGTCTSDYDCASRACSEGKCVNFLCSLARNGLESYSSTSP